MTLAVTKLQCEYRHNPIGIGERHPRLSWQISAPNRGVMQSAYHIQVSRDDRSFGHLVWDTGRVETDQSIHVEYQGLPVLSRVRYYYRIRVWDQDGLASDWSEPAFWEMGLLTKDEWGADWITDFLAPDSDDEPCNVFRSTFQVYGPVIAARIYATCLGMYELHLNGQRVGDWLLTPGWTSYDTRLQYQTYDITASLMQGTNAIGLTLGDGWFKGHLGWEKKRNLFGNRRAALVQLHIVYEDGREQIVGSGSSWRSATGPILMASIYHGETYDARLEKVGWNLPDYDDGGWNAAAVLHLPKDSLIAQENQPTRVIQEINPVQVIHTPNGETVLDMGQNMVGWVRFRVVAGPGTVITLQHAEVLDHAGNFYIGNLRSAKQTIRYVCKGNGVESFEPHFTFQGFRYVKVEGFPGELRTSFIARVIHTDMERTGSFKCSDELLNRLQQNIVWGQKGNFVDIPTDCPQRDERLGWTGDAQVFIRTAAFNMNVAPFFTKWLRDLKADQFSDGGVPHVIPNILGEEGRSAAWGDAAVICPWTLYLCYGDVRVLENQYSSMKAWVEYIRNQGNSEYLWITGSHVGDWLALDANENNLRGSTPHELIATAFYAHATQILANAARILEKHDDAAMYQQLYQRIVESFGEEFVTPSGRLASPTQTAHVLALSFDLVTGIVKERTSKTLAQIIEENGFRLTTGFVGTPYLCHALTNAGYADIAYSLVQQTEYPSWLYSVLHGATTIWEHWDSVKPDGSFWSDAMNSFNHYAYGSVGDWMYQVIGGIGTDVARPGYKHVKLSPRPGGSLTFANTQFESMYGVIRCEWAINTEEARTEITVQIPPNTTATVGLPGAEMDRVFERGTKVGDVHGVHLVRQLADGVEVDLGSGTYEFTYTQTQL